MVSVLTHDTNSAIHSYPFNKSSYGFINIGTWSLVGVSVDKPIITKKSLEYGFSNELGHNGNVHSLSNLCGMWVFEEVLSFWKKEGISKSYSEWIEIAEAAEPLKSLIDLDNSVFTGSLSNPVKLIQDYCVCTNQTVPQTEGEVLRSLLESVAFKVAITLDRFKVHLDTDELYVSGGATQNPLLMQILADVCNTTLSVCSNESTSIGNALIQLEEYHNSSKAVSYEKISQYVTLVKGKSSNLYKKSKDFYLTLL